MMEVALQENPALFKAIDQLGYRVTVGDVAVQSGLDLQQSQQGLMTLATNVGGHLQVSDTGEIVYLFPEDFRGILARKFWQLRLKNTLEKVWHIVFYGIRISFGIVLILSILIMLLAIVALIIASSQNGDKDNDRSDSGLDVFFSPNFFNLFYIFDFSPHHRRRSFTPDRPHKRKSKSKKQSKKQSTEPKLNLLEAIFSFLFGDGNPNLDLEERRWQGIGAIIRNHDGAIVAEQVRAYLEGGNDQNSDTEDYMLPVLLRFNGYPEVSPQGDLIYYFPELQVMAKETGKQEVPPYLKESLWRFSEASSGQIWLALGLGGFNLLLAIVLGVLLIGSNVVSSLGGYVAWVASIYVLLLLYALGFLAIPLVRSIVLRWRNIQVERRNRQREDQAQWLEAMGEKLVQKLEYAHQFAKTQVLTDKNMVYSTTDDLLDQEIERSAEIDAEWERRLEGK